MDLKRVNRIEGKKQGEGRRGGEMIRDRKSGFRIKKDWVKEKTSENKRMEKKKHG